MQSSNFVSFLSSVYELGRDQDISFLGGSIAFFAFVSIIPAMLLVLSVGSFLGGEQFAERVVSFLEGMLSSEGSQIVGDALADTGGMASVSAVSSVVLLWSALKVFRAIDVAFNRVYQADVSPSLGTQLKNGIVVFLSIGAGFVLLVAAQLIVMSVTPDRSLLTSLLRWAIIFPGLVILLTPLYYVMPPERVSVRVVLPGTVTAVLGIFLLQEFFDLYAANAAQYQAYGFVGAVILFMLWLYFGAMILLLGAIVNAVLEDVDPTGSPSTGVDDGSSPDATRTRPSRSERPLTGPDEVERSRTETNGGSIFDDQHGLNDLADGDTRGGDSRDAGDENGSDTGVD